MYTPSLDPALVCMNIYGEIFGGMLERYPMRPLYVLEAAQATLGFSRVTRTRTHHNPYSHPRAQVFVGVDRGFTKTQGYKTRARVWLRK